MVRPAYRPGSGKLWLSSLPVSIADFRELHEEFPELGDAKGGGWLYPHAHRVVKFIRNNQYDKRKMPHAEKIHKELTRTGGRRSFSFRIIFFNPKTKGGWVFHFDDAIGEALELGPLQNYEITLPEESVQLIEKAVPKNMA